MKKSNKAGINFILYFYLAIFAASIIFPLLWTVLTSVKSNQEFFANPWALTGKPVFGNYIRAWETANIGPYFLNSLYITVIVVAVEIIIGSMTSYALTRLKVKGSPFVTFLYMSGIFIPTILCVVPMFLQLRRVHLLDSHLGLILLYIATNLPFTVYVLNGTFRTLPHELEEAAIIDGCSYFRVYWNVMLPLAKPGIATVTIFDFLSVWNEYVIARSVILTPNKQTLAVGMVSLMQATNHQADWTALFAGMVIVMVPTMIIYLLFQKYITSGMTTGAIKG